MRISSYGSNNIVAGFMGYPEANNVSISGT